MILSFCAYLVSRQEWSKLAPEPSLEQDIKDVRWAELSADLEMIFSNISILMGGMRALDKRVADLEDRVP